jgi:hypothetical protein
VTACCVLRAIGGVDTHIFQLTVTRLTASRPLYIQLLPGERFRHDFTVTVNGVHCTNSVECLCDAAFIEHLPGMAQGRVAV